MEDQEKIAVLLKRALSIIEVVLSNEEGQLTTPKVEEYNAIVQQLNELGYSYVPHHKASKMSIGQAEKKPMVKATGRLGDSNETRKIS